MTQAKYDQNRVVTILAVSENDGDTTVPVRVNPSNHGLKVSLGDTGVDHGDSIASRDENRRPVIMGVSSVDGVTPIEIYTDDDGNLLIESI